MDRYELIKIIIIAGIAAFAKEIFSAVLTFSKNQINAKLTPIVQPIPKSFWMNLLITILNAGLVIYLLLKTILQPEPLTRPDAFLISFYTGLSFFWSTQTMGWIDKIRLARQRHLAALAAADDTAPKQIAGKSEAA